VGNSLCLDDIPPNGRTAGIVHLCPNSPLLQSRFIDGLATGRSAVSLDSISAEIYREPYVFAKRVLARADFYFPNREEGVMLYRYLKDGKLMSVPDAKETAASLSSRELVKIADHLQRFLDGVLCLKCDELGVVVADDEVIWEIPPFDVAEVVDPTGAGDTFAGAFLATYAQEQDIYYAAVNGCAASSFVIQGFGISRMLTTTHEDIMDVAEMIGEGKKWTL
jgi:sugar/nucleoside kinase (ribokinase family)